MDRTQQGPSKLRPIAELGKIAEQLRARGETIVLAHGTFDLLHVGHVKHLQAARAEGTVLMVTLTADKYVIKGPGRPVFTENLRAEMLASLECVDYVGIQNGATASEVIQTIKPQIYIKGSEYRNADDDLTGQILAEQQAVEAYGGHLTFTDELTFSSSQLINRYLDVYDPPLQGFLNTLRVRQIADRLLDSFNTIENLRVLVIGDAIVDEYIYAVPIGKSPKETIIATLYKNKEEFAGGVFATANHIANLCAEVEVISLLGAHDSFEHLIRNSLKPNVRFKPLIRDGVPTTRKTRFIEPSYIRKMFEVYHMEDLPISGELEDELDRLVAAKASQYDLVVVNDFGHGLITPRIVDTLRRCAKFVAVNTQTNSANVGYNLITKYKQAQYVAIDATEARLAAHEKFGPMETEVIRHIRSAVDCEHMIVTHGNHGCYAVLEDGAVVHIPAFTKTVVDTVGAGDAFFAVTSPFVATGLPMELVGVIGNAAGALKVGIVGHRKSVEKVPLMKYLTTLLK